MTRGETICRACSGRRLHPFLSLGAQPPANRFLRADERGAAEPAWPLDAAACLDCALVQVPDRLPRDFFDHYLYVPSASTGGPIHFDALAETLGGRAGQGLVVDIGCNDGLLLAACARRGLRVLGVDPAANLAAVARARGVPVVAAHFGCATATRLGDEHGQAAVVVCTNTLNHVDDLEDFAAGVAAWLAPDGWLVIEVPHVGDFVARNEFDTIYHEHLSTFSVRALEVLLATAGLALRAVEPLAVHGGSMRLWAGHARTAPHPGRDLHARARPGARLAAGPGSRGRADVGTTPEAQADGTTVAHWRDRERAAGLHEAATWDALRARVERNRDSLVALLRGRRAAGRRIAACGAPAKGNTLLQYCGIGPDLVEFVTDRSPLKQGLYTPGSHIPVVAPEHVAAARPDDLLILAWNFADEIVTEQSAHRARGGRFIVPIPEPTVLGETA